MTLHFLNFQSLINPLGHHGRSFGAFIIWIPIVIWFFLISGNDSLHRAIWRSEKRQRSRLRLLESGKRRKTRATLKQQWHSKKQNLVTRHDLTNIMHDRVTHTHTVLGSLIIWKDKWIMWNIKATVSSKIVMWQVSSKAPLSCLLLLLKSRSTGTKVYLLDAH